MSTGVKLNKLFKIAPSALANLKRIEKVVDKKKVIISAKFPEPQQQGQPLSLNKLLTLNAKRVGEDGQELPSYLSPCVLCNLEKENIFIQYTDIMVLRQFLKDDGTLLSNKITGICKKQQSKLHVLLKHARLAGLIRSDTAGSNENNSFRAYFDSYELLKRTRKYL